jgi:hypothetical protein
VRFRITRHSGSGSPPDALELLWEHLQGRNDDGVAFNRRGSELGASFGEDAPAAMERDEREEVGRLAVLESLREICERVPGLRFDWYAVGPRR